MSDESYLSGCQIEDESWLFSFSVAKFKASKKIWVDSILDHRVNLMAIIRTSIFLCTNLMIYQLFDYENDLMLS